MNFLITPRSVDSTLVSSHDYAIVSRLSTELDGLISAEPKFPTSSIVNSGRER